MTQTEINFTTRYPSVPGWKARETSRLAAESAKGEAATLRKRCLELLSQGEFTADELAEKLGRSILSIRPRVSELAKMKCICPTGQRRKNCSGNTAIVWRVV